MSNPSACLPPPSICPVCGGSPRPSLRLPQGGRLIRCRDCGLGWWDWSSFDPSRFYDRDYFQSASAARGYSDYRALEPGLRRTARGRLRRLGDRLASGPRADSPLVLRDLGCGTGVFLDEARRAGYQVSGVEVSAYAAERARERGLEVATGGIETFPIEPGSCDVITLWDVIEHLRDPAAAVRAMARGLKPGGVVGLSTGDLESWCARLSRGRWHLFNLPEHLFFFTRGSLSRLFEQNGLVVREVVREVNWVPLRYVAERLAKTFAGRDRQVPLGALAGWLVPATLGDVLGVYAVRRQAATEDPDSVGERGLDG